MRYLIMAIQIVIATCIAISQVLAEEPFYNPEPVYSSDRTAAYTERFVPRQVYPPSNRELCERYDALYRADLSFYRRNGRAEMADLQRNYDRHLSLKLGVEDPEKFDDSILEFLEWVPEVAESTEVGKPVNFSIKLQNISDRPITVSESVRFKLHFLIVSLRLTKTNTAKTPVVLRKTGAWELTDVYDPYDPSRKTVEIAPFEQATLKFCNSLYDRIEMINLAEYYDLNEPGEYELTFYTRRFVDANGDPAENATRQFPLQKTIRFTILPASKDKVKRAPLVFKYEDEKDALEEYQNPAPTPPPTNHELKARFDAVNKVKFSSENRWYWDMLPHWADFYNKRLSFMTDKLDLVNPAARTEELFGLKWRPIVPRHNLLGKPIIMRLGLENISEHEIYGIRTISAFNAPLVMASLRIVRTDAKGAREEASFTSTGAKRFYALTSTYGKEGLYPAHDVLYPGELFTGFVIYDRSDSSEFDLTKYYDLSKPGEYELTFYTRRFVNDDGSPADDMVRPYPLPDTVRFTISGAPLYP